jgi:hypothetical protein
MAKSLVEQLRQRQYLFPGLVGKELDTIRAGWIGPRQGGYCGFAAPRRGKNVDRIVAADLASIGHFRPCARGRPA